MNEFQLLAEYLKMTHGHIVPNENGLIARCMGEHYCKNCKFERELFNLVRQYIENGTLKHE